MEIQERAVGAPPTAGEDPTVAALAVDLRTLVGLRSRTAVRDRHLPALLALLPPGAAGDRELRYRTLQDLVGDAVDAVRDPAHRQAATALFGFGDRRWRPLTQRGAEAARTFGLGWDAYRRRRPSTGSSLLEETIEELARGLVPPRSAAAPTASTSPLAPAPVDPPPVIVAPVPDPPSGPDRSVAPSGPGRGRRPALLLAGAALVVAALVALAVVVTRSGDDDGGPTAAPTTEPAACGVLTGDIGDLPPDAGTELRRWVEPFEAAASELPAASIRCASTIEANGDQVLQRISGDGDPGVAALVASAEGPPAVVALDPVEFPAFRDHQLDQPSPTARIGTPIRRADRDGLRVIEFTDGVLVREEVGSPPIVVVQNTWRRWLELGGLDGAAGRPLTNRYGLPGVGEVQEFTGGDLIVPFTGEDVRWEPRAASEQQLPDGHRGAVLTTRGRGGSWLIDRSGVRHWITTETAYACATRSLDATAITDVSAAAIAALPAGAPYPC